MSFLDRLASDQIKMSTPSAWPNLFLPLVNRTEKGTSPQAGMLFDSDEYRHTVFLANMWDENIDLKKVEKVEFHSFIAMVEAGWEVD